jgi:hypothetical protein
MVAVAKLGQPWSEVEKMPDLVRKCFLLTNAVSEGASVNWKTGEIKPPKVGA